MIVNNYNKVIMRNHLRFLKMHCRCMVGFGLMKRHPTKHLADNIIMRVAFE